MVAWSANLSMRSVLIGLHIQSWLVKWLYDELNSGVLWQIRHGKQWSPWSNDGIIVRITLLALWWLLYMLISGEELWKKSVMCNSHCKLHCNPYIRVNSLWFWSSSNICTNYYGSHLHHLLNGDEVQVKYNILIFDLVET